MLFAMDFVFDTFLWILCFFSIQLGLCQFVLFANWPLFFAVCNDIPENLELKEAYGDVDFTNLQLNHNWIL